MKLSVPRQPGSTRAPEYDDAFDHHALFCSPRLFLSRILRERRNQRSFMSCVWGLARARREGGGRLKLLKLRKKTLILRKEGYAEEFPRINRVCQTKESVKLLPPVLWEDSQRQEFAKGNTVFGRKAAKAMHYSSRLVNFKRLDVSNSKVAPLERYHRRDRPWGFFVLREQLNKVLSYRTYTSDQSREPSEWRRGRAALPRISWFFRFDVWGQVIIPTKKKNDKAALIKQHRRRAVRRVGFVRAT